MYSLNNVSAVDGNIGKPIINIDMQTITYVEHTPDAEYIITVEYGGVLNELLYCLIDG